MALGFPIVRFLIGIAIILVARDATMRVWHRLMDAVQPAVIDQIEQHASEVTGVAQVASVRELAGSQPPGRRRRPTYR
jgi:divalent metal cation (Fe/Co/Zn/Cd) transporter